MKKYKISYTDKAGKQQSVTRQFKNVPSAYKWACLQCMMDTCIEIEREL